MTNEKWFNPLFTQITDGIVVDIVTKDQFECHKPPVSPIELPRGKFIKPVLPEELKQPIQILEDGTVSNRQGTCS